MDGKKLVRVKGDFNGLFGRLLCLSHGATVEREDGQQIPLAAGAGLLAFEDDSFEGETEFLVASGIVVPAPPDLRCLGSKWCLEIDDGGVRRVSALGDA